MVNTVLSRLLGLYLLFSSCLFLPDLPSFCFSLSSIPQSFVLIAEYRIYVMLLQFAFFCTSIDCSGCEKFVFVLVHLTSAVL